MRLTQELQPVSEESAVPPSLDESPVNMDRISILEAENRELKRRIDAMLVSTGSEVVVNDDAILQEVGVYRYHHPLECAADYQDKLAELNVWIS